MTIDDLNREIHFVKENTILTDDSRSHEKFMHGIKVLLAKNYIDNLSEETKKGMLEKAEQGIYPSFAPIGYINVECQTTGKRIIQPDPEYAPLVTKLFQWYAAGHTSVAKITERAAKEGLIYRRSKRKIGSATVAEILKNPIYYGDFRWDGKLYHGKHTPLVSKELFEIVQKIRTGRNNSCESPQKHDFLFKGLVRCQNCGGLLTGETKKGKYTYYSCMPTKACPGRKYVREEILDREFSRTLHSLKFDPPVLAWIKRALQESHSNEKQYHDDVIANLQAEYSRLQNRLDTMYVDKLDGRITNDFYTERYQEWRGNQDEILRKIKAHENANDAYLEEGVKIFELAQGAGNAYDRQKPAKKKELLKFVYSNSTWDGEKLVPEFREPFDIISVMAIEAAKKKAEFPKKSDPYIDWLPGPDSNQRQGG